MKTIKISRTELQNRIIREVRKQLRLFEAPADIEDSSGSSDEDIQNDKTKKGPDPDAIDSDGDGGDEPTGAVNNDISGKTIQSLSIEAESKVLPGSKEVVLSFNETTDTLRILVTPTGNVKFSWRGQLHDLP